MSISGLQARHQVELENMTLTSQPFKTLKFFILAIIQYLKRSVCYLVTHGIWLMLASVSVVLVGVLLVTIDGPHEKHVNEILQYLEFGLWWVALGVASSIGLAFMSGRKLDGMEELDASSAQEKGRIATHLNQMKRWFLSHAQYLNFFTILVLASTVFIISVCNNQLLDSMENELIWILGLIPGFSSAMPHIITKLHAVKEKYMEAKPSVPSNMKVNKWDFSFASVWNTVVWIVLLNFFFKIMTAMAQRYLKKQQEKELVALQNKSSVHQYDHDNLNR